MMAQNLSALTRNFRYGDSSTATTCGSNVADIELGELGRDGRAIDDDLQPPPPAYCLRPASVQLELAPVATCVNTRRPLSWKKTALAALANGALIAAGVTGAYFGGKQSRNGAIDILSSSIKQLSEELNATKPIYSRLQQVTPVAAYNAAYGTQYSDDPAGRQSLFSAASVPFNSSMQINSADSEDLLYTSVNCSISDQMVTGGGNWDNDLRVLAHEGAGPGNLGVVTGSGEVYNSLVDVGFLNITGTRGPLSSSIFAAWIGRYCSGCGVVGGFTYKPTLNGKVLDPTQAMVLASPSINGIHSGYLLAFDDGSQQFNRPILQIGSTAPPPDKLMCASFGSWD